MTTTAIITGATSGMGRAATDKLAQSGSCHGRGPQRGTR
jgi:NAD(P)-dependent dehydrogenase (short-subunit alcohol dehydrogenase family)